MTKIEFVKKLYNGKNCYSDHMDASELQLLHIASNAEKIIVEMLSHNRIVFLTGNPGDGKTFIIKTISSEVDESKLYIQTDLNNVKDYSCIVQDIIGLYKENKVNWQLDIVLSHTVPIECEPVWAFIPGLDQSTVDKSTEKWLQYIYDNLEFTEWYAGHYHVECEEGGVRIMFEEYDEIM